MTDTVSDNLTNNVSDNVRIRCFASWNINFSINQ